jgi:hypothetical protein
MPKKILHGCSRCFVCHMEHSSNRIMDMHFKSQLLRRLYGTEATSCSRYVLCPLPSSVLWAMQYSSMAVCNRSLKRKFSTTGGETVPDSAEVTPSSIVPPNTHADSTSNPSDPDMITNHVTTTDILELLNQTAVCPIGSFGTSEYIRARNYFFLLSMERTPTPIYTSLQERLQKESVKASAPSGDLVKTLSFNGPADTTDSFTVTDAMTPSKVPPAEKNYKFHIQDSTTHDRIAIGLRLYERLLRELRHAFTPPAASIDASDPTESNFSTVVEAESSADAPDMASLTIEWGGVKYDSIPPAEETPDAMKSENDTLSPPTASAAEVAAKWILDPYQTIHPLLSEWKQEFLQRQRPMKNRRFPTASHLVLPASTIVATLQRCYEIYRPLQCWNDPKTVKIILEMIILQTADRAVGAVEADRFVSYVQHQQHFLFEQIQSNEAPKPSVLYKYPTMDMYRQLLHVWVNSGQTSKALRRVPGLMRDMRLRLDVKPPISFYNALLQLHAQSGMTEQEAASARAGSIFGREHRNKVDSILQSIANEESLQPTLETWLLAVQCYSKWHCFYEAQDIVLKQMIPIVSTAPVDVQLEFEDRREGEYNLEQHTSKISSSELLDRACEHIIIGYRRILHLPIKRNIMNQDERNYMINRATLFVQQMQRINLLSSKALGIAFGYM